MKKPRQIAHARHRKIRIIPKLEIKGENLIKGVQLEGLRILGDPSKYAREYYADGADEIIYYDVVASLFGRNSLLNVVKKTASEIFIPLTVGGGVRSTGDVRDLLQVGADKISVNTAAIRRPKLITEIAEQFGSQCCVVEVQTKFAGNGKWMALIENGREHSGKDAVEWACEAAKLGAGELLLTSVDRDGTKSGMDKILINEISGRVNIPIIASGGVGGPDDVVDALKNNVVNAVAIGSILHYHLHSIQEVKKITSEALDSRI